MMDFPVIDLKDYLAGVTGADDQLATALNDALENIGFYAIVNHGINQKRIDGIFQHALNFHALPPNEKMLFEFSEKFTGYIPPSKYVIQTSKINENTVPDLNASYFMEREDPPKGTDIAQIKKFHSNNQWPTTISGFRDELREYFFIMENFAQRILPLYALALGLPLNYFDEAFTWPQASLRLSHYPPIERKINQFGIAPHTDAGFLTILPQSEIHGLHIRPHGEDWTPVPKIPGALFINSGDMLKRWTNDRFLSTQHMAINETNQDRYAAVFFFSPNLEYEMHCLPTCQSSSNPARYEPITYEAYRTWFMDSNYRPETKSRSDVEPI